MSNQSSPAITVLLPVYNSGDLVAQTIESILAQTFTDFELLIINDGSTDHSASIVAQFTDSRIRFIHNEKNIGLIATLNKGAILARGRYIARMDADDIALPQRLEKQSAFLDANPQVAVAASWVDFINTDGEVTGQWDTDRHTVTETDIRRIMPGTNCIAHPSVMIRTEIVQQFLYSDAQKGAEDYDLWLRMMAAGKRIAKLPEVLLHYRIHPASITVQLKASEPVEKRLLRIKRKFMTAEILRGRFSKILWAVLYSMLRNAARHIIKNKLPAWLRDLKRIFTESPLQLAFERRRMDYILSRYTGNKIFVFPYTHVGGAEQVHADIVRVFTEEKPVVIFSGFSENEKFLHLFEPHAQVLNIPALLNHPFTRARARRVLCHWFSKAEKPVFFGSNAAFFYDMLPHLPPHTRSIDLIHAFKYQPGGNTAHQSYLRYMPRMESRIFVSEAARKEFDTFCFHHNIPAAERHKLKFISNTAARASEPVKAVTTPLRILFVGRHSPEKRLTLFLQIAAQLHRSHAPQFAFTVVGATAPSPEYNFIDFKGELTRAAEVAAQYAAADVLVLTSSREGFPMVIMEAMMHGVLVVATPVGDIPNRLSNECCVVLSSPEEEIVVKETVQALMKMAANPEKTTEQKHTAKAFAEKQFSEEKFAKAYQQLLNEAKEK
ncbi:MAG: glycosyltransferase [Bacteroidia bacterium]|jgi:glycosyltransferase involved in cell wall biosynthesis|nr:glycosyltransferase [Bacteroidia bacterium]